MASRFAKTPLFQVQRTLSAHPHAIKAEASQIEISKLGNGLTVASVAEGNGLSSIGLSVKAGSRYEGYDDSGVSHALRAAIGLSSTNFTGFGITRHIQQAGSNLAASADRELVLYHSTSVPKNISKVADYMLEAITNPLFRRWEVPKAFEQLKIHVAEKDDLAKTVDAFHKAAYGNVGLGKSLVCPEHMLGKFNGSILETYHQKTHTADRMLLIGMGVAHRTLESFGSELPLNTGAGPSSSSKYYGGDAHVDSVGNVAHIIIGAEVLSGSVKMKDQAAAYLLQKILGDGQKIKYSSLSGKLPKVLPADGFHATNGIFFGYSDSALLGAFIACDAQSAGENVSKIAAALRNISVTDADVKAAKKIAAMEMAERSFDKLYTMDMIGYLHHFEGDAAARIDNVLDSLTVADVQAVAKKLSNAKFSIGASGNCCTIPRADSL